MTPAELLAPFAGIPCGFLADWIRRCGGDRYLDACAADARRRYGPDVAPARTTGGGGVVRHSRASDVLQQEIRFRRPPTTGQMRTVQRSPRWSATSGSLGRSNRPRGNSP
jgi:hypothetical protein